MTTTSTSNHIENFRAIAPTRVDLAGGTLDLWPLYCMLGSARTINVAVNLNASVLFSVSPNPQCEIFIKSAAGDTYTFHQPIPESQIQNLKPSLQFPVTVVCEYLRNKFPFPKKKIQIEIRTEAPVGSGLGGSSALCVALARGLARAFGDFQEQGWQWPLLDWVKDVEAHFLKVPTGTQDYLAALFGGLRCYLSQLGGIRIGDYEKAVFEELSSRMVVLFSGEMHQSGLSNWEIYKSAIEGTGSVKKGLEKLGEVANELDGELRNLTRNWDRIGQLLDEEWNIRKGTFNVQTTRINEIVSYLKKKGALGVRVCGAAQGGSLVAIVKESERNAFIGACKNAEIQVLPAQPTEECVRIENLSMPSQRKMG